MAVDIFIKIGDIKGESMDKAHKDEIDVLNWSWGMSQSGNMHVGSGGGAGKVNVQDLSLTKFVDKASPNLMMHCASGKHIDKVKLTVRKAGGESQVEYMIINLEEVLVTSLSTGGLAHGQLDLVDVLAACAVHHQVWRSPVSYTHLTLPTSDLV